MCPAWHSNEGRAKRDKRRCTAHAPARPPHGDVICGRDRGRGLYLMLVSGRRPLPLWLALDDEVVCATDAELAEPRHAVHALGKAEQ